MQDAPVCVVAEAVLHGLRAELKLTNPRDDMCEDLVGKDAVINGELPKASEYWNCH